MAAQVTCTKYVPAAKREEKLFPKEEPIIVTEPHKPPKIRAEVEPPTSNMTLYGVCKPNPNPPPRWPKSYDPKDWVSVTKTDFPVVRNDDRITKDLQIERANFMRTSNVTIGDRSQKPERVTQHVSYKPYDRERLVEKKCFPIGGKYNKVRSDVQITGDEAEPRQYETLALRQFQPHQVDSNKSSKDREHQLKNKQDMMRSHFAVSEAGKTDYRTVASVPLPSNPPPVKGRPPSAVEHSKNPHFVASAADARPRTLTAQEVSQDKSRSSIPLTMSDVPSLRATTTAQALPRFRAVRQGIVTSTNTTISSLSFGADKTEYKPATRTQFQGIFFKPAATQ